MRIPITKPDFRQEEFDALVKPLESGWLVQGPNVKEFENSVASFSKAQSGIATTSCTTALHLALILAGVDEDSEVIVPAFTYVASANAIRYTGANPVFVDIDLKTFNIAVDQIEEKITDKTKAIVPVHLFGLSADMSPIMEIAKKYNLAVIEDAACGLGATYNGKHVGNFGVAGCLSFHPRKILTTGEGGMILTNSEEFDKNARIMRDHGASIPDHARHENKGVLLPEFPVVGYNYRMTDLQASIGVTQMQRVDEILQKRRRIASKYGEALPKIDMLCEPVIPENCEHSFQSYVCLFGKDANPKLEVVEELHEKRNEFMMLLEEAGVSTRQGTHAVHMLQYYKEKYKLTDEMFPNSYIADKLTLALPLYTGMTDDEFDFVISKIEEIIN